MADEVGNGENGTVAAENGGVPAVGSRFDQDEKTVQRLRFGVGAIGVLLPIVLPFGNWVFVQFGHHTQIWPSSMSSSYYTSTRNIFVGSMCALGVFLLGYRSTAKADTWTTVVGIVAIGVALFPTAPHPATDFQSAIGYVHLSCAGITLAGLGAFCIASFHHESNASRAPEQTTKNYGYLTAGILIFVLVAVAIIAGLTKWGAKWTLTPLYVCEGLSVWAFGAAWIAAALELGNPWPSLTARLKLRPRRRVLASPQH
jgi:hypothetical protein